MADVSLTYSVLRSMLVMRVWLDLLVYYKVSRSLTKNRLATTVQ